METLFLPKVTGVNGLITLPGSKSISNRILLLAALCGEIVTIHNLLTSDDTDRMKEALLALGINIEDLGNNTYTIKGEKGFLKNKKADLFLGNAGTAFRSLTALLALNGGYYTLKGIPRMHERPIKDLVDALNQLGLAVHYLENEGYPPLAIEPATVTYNEVSVKGSVSSQYLTALLLTLPMVNKNITINIDGKLISKPYIDITLTILQRFGINIDHDDYQRFYIKEGAEYCSPGEIYVEGDASSASYFLAAGAIAGKITVHGAGKESIQGDIQFATVLEKMGAQVSWDDYSITVSPPLNRKLRGLDLDCNDFPDAAMTLAIVALYAEGETILRNIGSWRVKETDRIAAMATELTKLGVVVEEGSDYIVVYPCDTLTDNVSIKTYDDHRIAMCFSLCAFKNSLTILDPQCVDKTFPEYFSIFKSIIE